ncbi:4-hydroxy-tetrahydrodipicolinate synthase [Pseudonocardia asaccharolytica]|uniref:4-hydroxy-tetrahydrodipicolinate synthase n=1 Tax=Pseudonocardia asaccharolytica DSM 44247 = NBRC 16224 TaxID=1123024 RepID=A0A511CW63_9PSEU|nr:4-hydroxy-tetrahydrodipicolinate synthase [Pseudonocardia asaccharolytica]GEL16816.1 4-hydroxy-tetrahydrodipicolinate synthase [Pseudonocardia asaccharolytica DSM 44247 = NBRC 16224]
MITGSIVALVTPMRADGSLDHEALAKLVDRTIEAGTSAIVSVGTTGESATLDVDEHTDVIRRTIDVAGDRVPIIAGTGANSTSEAIHLTRAAKQAGADAALLVTPYYNKPPQEGLYRHFRAVAEAVDIPQILYNVPGRTACDMLPATVARLAAVPNIIGIKEALGDLGRVRDLVALGLDDFALYSGDDATARESMLAGFHGNISVTANVAPDAMAKMCAAAIAGDAETAAAIDADLAELHRKLFIEPNPIPVKWALAELGLMEPGIRLPLVPLDEAHHEAVRAALRTAGLLG